MYMNKNKKKFNEAINDGLIFSLKKTKIYCVMGLE